VKELAWLLPFDQSDARRVKQRSDVRKRRILISTRADAALFGVLCLPMAAALLLKENGDFGTSPIFGQLSNKPQLARV
jgi:hypothetical protein